MKKSSIAFITLLVLSLGILFLVFGKILQHPNSYVFSPHDDAAKSYYNFCYYLKYDSGIRHDGINYPYGDHLQYINSHPLYVQILKFVDGHLFSIADYGVGILNLTMIFSLWMAVPFIYLILRKYKLPPWYSAIITLIILFLSPQLDRLGGHFEMVYAFFIPLYWYLLIRWQEGEKRWVWTSLLLVTALVGGFTSAYYAAFLAIFPLALLLVEFWNKRKDLRAWLPEGIHLLLLALVPLIMVKGLVSATDWVDDRPDNPWGFFIFHSNIFSIFLPPGSSLQEALKGITDISFQWEGRAYVGLPAMLAAFGILIALLLQMLRGKRPHWESFFPERKMNVFLASAVIVLLFAMCIPFKWGLKFLPDLIPPLKQFRCLGRFSWIFYYGFTTYTAWLLYRGYQKLRETRYRVYGLSALILLVSMWALEAAAHTRKSTRFISNENTMLVAHGDDVLKSLDESGYGAEDFQAIFFLPYASTCGDKLLFTRGMKAFGDAMQCSYQTALPLVQSFSPRLSFTHAMSSIQLLSDSCIYKQRVEDMDERPLLLVVSGEELNREEKLLLDRSEIFHTGEGFILARLDVEQFNTGHDSWLDLLENSLDSLSGAGSMRSSCDPSLILYKDFEEYDADHVFTGSGARHVKEGSFELVNEKEFAPWNGIEMEISMWVYVDHRTDNMPQPVLITRDREGKVREQVKFNSREEHNTDGMWTRMDLRFTPVEASTYQLIIRGRYISVDDLLVKPADGMVVVMDGATAVLFDNFRIPVVALD